MHLCKIGVPLLLFTAGCAVSGPRPAVDPLARLRHGPAVAATAIWPLERSGAAPNDTLVSYSPKQGRRIVLRQGPPDHAIFLLLDLPADSTAAPGDTVVLSIRPTPARYGVTLSSSSSFPEGSTGTFSYAMHFVQPAGSESLYPTPTSFDQRLGAVHLVDSLRVRFLQETRPASDLITFPVANPGTYFLAAPK